MNNWNVPLELEKLIRERDRKCVYCGREFDESVRPTWEHIINDEKIITYENIALCCNSCNSSKSNKDLLFWLGSSYCLKKKININTVAGIIKKAIVEMKNKKNLLETSSQLDENK